MLILIQLDVEHLPFSYADASMTALMRLVTIVTTKILHGASRTYFYLVNSENTKASATETLGSL